MRLRRSFIGNTAKLGKALAQTSDQMMCPDVLGGKNDQSDKQEQHTLQHWQKQTHDPEHDETPANRQGQGAFNVSVHPAISGEELSYGTIKFIGHFFVGKMSCAFEGYQPAIFKTLLQLRG